MNYKDGKWDGAKDYADVVDRVEALRSSVNVADRQRVRAVMNGGAVGVQAVLNWSGGERPAHGHGSGHGADSDLGVDLPTANVMYSGMERLAQRVGRQPIIKTDTLPVRDTSKARKFAEKRARIVNGWDSTTRMELQYPQIGRWLPGYGFTLHVIREQRFGTDTYPVAELRDPYDVYPGMWGVDQQPQDVAIIRHMSRKRIRRAYPEFEETFALRWDNKSSGSTAVPILGQNGGNWEGNPNNPIEVIEYMCCHGTHVLIPECGIMAGFIPNPLDSGPAFVVTKRYSFDLLQSQYHHVFGTMAMMGKLNILGLIATEDSVFRETNIIGEMIGDVYERGRSAINIFEPGTRVEKPTGEQLQQVWQAINVLERQFRIVANYDVAQDGQSPNSFATGQGIRELGAAANDNVREYQLAIQHGIELVDRKRLEWDDMMHASKSKRIFWYEGSAAMEETYTPATDIDGDYRTRRVYGAMASFDENQKVITGLQLLQAKVLDRRTIQENLDGIDNVSLINERIDQDGAKEQAIMALGQRAAEKDPAAMEALVSIIDKPSEAIDTLKQLLTSQEPQMTPEQQAMMGGMPGAGAPPDALQGGPPPPVQTILAQMEGEGGGAMSVGQMS